MQGIFASCGWCRYASVKDTRGSCHAVFACLVASVAKLPYVCKGFRYLGWLVLVGFGAQSPYVCKGFR